MSGGPLVLTYHAIAAGPPPLCIEPALFRLQLELIAESRARVVTLHRLLETMGEGERPGEPLVAITFDDGFSGVVEHAAPALAEAGMPATVFCVAGHLGGRNDWPTEPACSPRMPLASAEALADVTASTPLELGSHGMHHQPLARADRADLRREIVDSRRVLEDAVGTAVPWFAYPYDSAPAAEGRRLVERTYRGACGGGNRRVGPGADRYRLPRVDPHYLRRPVLLRRVLEGGDAYLRLRRLGARARRLVRRDFAGGVSRAAPDRAPAASRADRRDRPDS